jgi:hypothetical protein
MKLLILANRPDHISSVQLKTAGENLGIDTTVCSYKDITWQFTTEKIEAVIDDISLETFNGIFIYSEGNFVDTIILISEFCRLYKIPLFDHALLNEQPWALTKSFEYLKLHECGLPIIPTLLLSQKKFEMISDQMSYPCIVKIENLDRGEGVFLCQSSEDVIKIYNQHPLLLLQPFLRNDGDLRLLVIGEDVVGCIKRSSESGGFKNNISQGGQAMSYVPSSDLISLAIQSAKALDYQFAGIDLICDISGDWKVMEVNRAPQFQGLMEATGVDVPAMLLAYIQKELIARTQIK